MSQRPEPRQLTVLRRDRITPSLQRVTVGGPGLAGFPADQEGGYLKLFLGEAENGKPIVRTYTIRHQRDGELEEGLLHAPAGPKGAFSGTKETGPCSLDLDKDNEDQDYGDNQFGDIQIYLHAVLFN